MFITIFEQVICPVVLKFLAVGTYSWVNFRTITFPQSTIMYMRVENLQPVFTADYATVDSSCLVIKFANWSW